MKSVMSKFIRVNHSTIRMISFGIITLMLGTYPLFSQAYNPQTGNTHYPNGTIYVESSDITNGPIVSGPKLANGDWERVDCTKNEKRCAELLKEADDDAAAGGGGISGTGAGDNGSGGATTQSLDSEMATQTNEYRTKQLKIKYGVWANQKGKWYFIDQPSDWTSEIIRSWKKRK
ncbi:MAG: hypothetical protein WAT37_16925 [Saprospiraceae bacterium]|nr:hypothetical protein [Saprospiraceae bacterium]